MTTTYNGRLTSLSHGGGCGCKIAPAILSEILAKMPLGVVAKELLVGTETSDDAAVWRLNDSQALVATTDFFMPAIPFAFLLAPRVSPRNTPDRHVNSAIAQASYTAPYHLSITRPEWWLWC